MDAAATRDPTRLQILADTISASRYLSQVLKAKDAVMDFLPVLFALQALAGHPATGLELFWAILTQALEVNTRNRALMVLEDCAQAGMDTETRQSIRDRLLTIPVLDIRDQVRRLL